MMEEEDEDEENKQDQFDLSTPDGRFKKELYII